MNDLHGEDLVQRARAIAIDAHTGQCDKAGRPYIGHPSRVAHRLNDPDAKAAGWLHDVLEDTRDLEPARQITADDLAAAGIPAHVIAAVEALTHTHGEPRDVYHARIVAAGPLAVRVKHADIDDNTDPERLAQLDNATRTRLIRKYNMARRALDPQLRGTT